MFTRNASLTLATLITLASAPLAADNTRDENGVRDHRTTDAGRDANNTADHRDQGTITDPRRGQPRSSQGTQIANAPAPIVRDHREQSDERPNEIVVVGQGAKKCHSGLIKLFLMGYTDISVLDCNGAIFKYGATNGPGFYHASMSSHSGDINVEFVGLLSD